MGAKTGFGAFSSFSLKPVLFKNHLVQQFSIPVDPGVGQGPKQKIYIIKWVATN